MSLLKVILSDATAAEAKSEFTRNARAWNADTHAAGKITLKMINAKFVRSCCFFDGEISSLLTFNYSLCNHKAVLGIDRRQCRS